MDDPWGSPWAADDTQLKLDLPAPPPQVHTPQTPHKIASPWARDDEDDAWGGWNAAEGGAGTNSPGWGRSPGLRPARSGTLSRHVSPEPWGRLGMLDSRSDVTEERKSEHDAPVTVDSAISLGEEPLATNVHADQENLEPKQAIPLQMREEKAEPVQNMLDLNRGSVETVDEAPDRPQSPDGDPSRAITALDRPEATRQASKVQELVHMYDGIAKKRNSPAEPLVAGPRIVLVGSDEIEDQEDEARPRPPTAKDEPPETILNLLKDDSHADSEIGTTSEDSDSSAKPEEAPDKERQVTTSEVQPPPSTYVKAPSIPYAYDLNYLDELFPSTPAPSIDPEPVPDVIIDDTFASISERKGWYRISRRGPMRQHNQGNDEDYVRLNWQSSEVRSQTLQIVRRWMEEDSIAGRVVLGRRMGPIGASMFNWDSQAPQMEIGELFGKKSHHRSISAASKTSKGSLSSPSSATFAWSAGNNAGASVGKPSLEEPKYNGWIAPPLSTASPVTPSFGWSSEPQGLAAPASTAQEADIPAKATKKAPLPMFAPPPQPMQSVETVMSAGPSSGALKDQIIEEAEDDDEWGEMISSPTGPQDAAFPATELSTSAVPNSMVKVEDDPLPTRSPTLGTGSELYAMSTPVQTTQQEPDKMMLNSWKEVEHEEVKPILEPNELDPLSLSPTLITAGNPPLRATDAASTVTPSIAEARSKQASGKTPAPMSHDEQEFMKRTLRDLPDLSYMLR